MLIEALLVHSSNENIAWCACDTLANLSTSDEFIKYLELLKTKHNRDGVASVEAVIKIHSNSARVQRCGGAALVGMGVAAVVSAGS
jgi:hypothetical protein